MTCAKQTVRCTIVTAAGLRFVGTNGCRNPQQTCPREPGEGYEKCKSVCQQVGHAEDVALGYLLQSSFSHCRGAYAYIEGHTRICDSCLRLLSAYGIEPHLGPPPP